MMPIVILLGVAVLYMLHEQQMTLQAYSSSARNSSGVGDTYPPPIQTGIHVAPLPTSVGGMSGLALGAAGAEAGLQAASDWASSAAQAGSAVAGAVGAAIPFVGAAIAPIFSLLAAHSARVKGAQTENKLLAEIQPAVQADLQSIIAAVNARQVTPSQALTAITQVQENYWQAVAGVEHGAGQAGGPQSCSQYSPPLTPKVTPGYVLAGTVDYWHGPCNNQCTASCCVGCNNIMNWLATLSTAIQAGRPKTLYFRGIVGSHYGNPGMNAWTAQLY